MTSQPVQNKYAKLSLPIWKSSYDDPAVTKGQESLIAAAKVSHRRSCSRGPTTPSYTGAVDILQKNLQQVLLGQATPEQGDADGDQGGGTAALTEMLPDPERGSRAMGSCRSRDRQAWAARCCRSWSSS